MGTTAAGSILYQCGALPFSIAGSGNVRVLLVTTRGSRRWIIPKGWPMRHLTAAATAAQEAYEEAGLVGTIVGDQPIGCYRYEKRFNARKAVCEVAVFLFAVERQLQKWPEKAERQTRWFSPAEASAVVDSPELGRLVLDAVAELSKVGALPTA